MIRPRDESEDVTMTGDRSSQTSNQLLFSYSSYVAPTYLSSVLVVIHFLCKIRRGDADHVIAARVINIYQYQLFGNATSGHENIGGLFLILIKFEGILTPNETSSCVIVFGRCQEGAVVTWHSGARGRKKTQRVILSFYCVW